MKIAIIGAGAMGSIYGGHLSLKNEVYLIDTNEDIISSIKFVADRLPPLYSIPPIGNIPVKVAGNNV